MECFGFISSDLQPSAYWKRWNWIPERWRYWSGLLPAGKLYGLLGEEQLPGWGWSLPWDMRVVWKEAERKNIWERFGEEVAHKNITIIGVTNLPDEALEANVLPGISDGKCLELLLFIEQFETILNYYGIDSQKDEIAVLWEEGNLGVTCARLIAPKLRFLRLVHPDSNRLDQAAALIMAETGISAKVQINLPLGDKKIKMIIRCGRMLRYINVWDGVSIVPCWELFSGRQDLFMQLQQKPIGIVRDRFANLPLTSILGETLIRVFAGDQAEQWVGRNLRIERIYHLRKLMEDFRLQQYPNG